MTILQSKLHPDDGNGDVNTEKNNCARYADREIAALQESLRLNAIFSSRAAQ